MQNFNSLHEVFRAVDQDGRAEHAMTALVWQYTRKLERRGLQSSYIQYGLRQPRWSEAGMKASQFMQTTRTLIWRALKTAAKKERFFFVSKDPAKLDRIVMPIVAEQISNFEDEIITLSEHRATKRTRYQDPDSYERYPDNEPDDHVGGYIYPHDSDDDSFFELEDD